MGIKELNEMRDQYYKALQAEGSDAIIEECQAFFEKNPDIKALGWLQYTPSFNDGEPCTFGVGELHVTTEDNYEDLDLYEWEYCSDDDLYGNILSNEDLLLTVFGDDKQIIITRDGIDISYYDCGY